jgi:hypothetical protein
MQNSKIGNVTALKGMNCLKNDKWASILPKQADNQFQGYKIAAIVFFIATLFTLARSCIHIAGATANSLLKAQNQAPYPINSTTQTPK